MQELADNIIELTLSIANVNPPWVLELWAKDITNRFRTPEVAKYMVFNYLNIVDGLLSSQPGEPAKFIQELSEKHAPFTNLSYFWQKALEWKQVVEDYFKGVLGEAISTPNGGIALQTPETLRQVREKINEYRPKVEAQETNIGRSN